MYLEVWSDVFFFKQKTAYEMRISDWSSDVCSSVLPSTARHAKTSLFLALRSCTWGTRMTEKPSAFRPSIKAATSLIRSEERRVGKECVSPCRSRWSPYH